MVMPQRPLNILLIDDDKDELSLFESALKHLGFAYNLYFKLNCTENIIEFLMIERPDIIFLDIDLPGKNGMRFLAELKSDIRFKSIPVIMYSVSARAEDIQKSFNLSAAHYLVKPYAEINYSESLKKIFKTDWLVPQPKTDLENFVINTSFVS